MIFTHPLYFLLLLLLIPIVWWYIWKQHKFHADIRLSSSEGFKDAPKTYKRYTHHSLVVFRILAIFFVIVALTRPQMLNNWNKTTTEGIDIVLVIDISSSMLAEDLNPNRLEAAKEVATSFINGRSSDNIGLVVFSGESFTQCPLTTDHTTLLNLLKNVRCGMIEDGTAIGHGLATAVSRLKECKTKSKVIILLTDGTNNRGEISPITAGEIAKSYHIRVYTIGVGTEGEAPYPYKTPFGIRYQNVPVEIDEAILTKIAQITRGLYFRATNTNALKKIYKEIDKLEKTKMHIQKINKKQERYLIFSLFGFLSFLIEFLLRYQILRNIP